MCLGLPTAYRWGAEFSLKAGAEVGAGAGHGRGVGRPEGAGCAGGGAAPSHRFWQVAPAVVHTDNTGWSKGHRKYGMQMLASFIFEERGVENVRNSRSNVGNIFQVL